MTQIEIAKTKRLRLTPDFDFDSDFDLEKSEIQNLMEEGKPQLAEARHDYIFNGTYGTI
jgi:hypothetical protein